MMKTDIPVIPAPQLTLVMVGRRSFVAPYACGMTMNLIVAIVTQWISDSAEKGLTVGVLQTSNPATSKEGNTHNRKDLYAVRENY